VLDIRRIQENPEELEEMLRKRNFTGVRIDDLKSLIRRTKDLKYQLDEARSARNAQSKEIGNLISSGQRDEAERRKEEVRKIGDEIARLEKSHADLEEELAATVLGLPNFIDDEVPIGADADSNTVIRTVGERPHFAFAPGTHYEIGEALGTLDFERGVKLSGSRFYTYRGFAASLERALINFMLDTHTKRFGYTEMWVPQLVNDEAMTTTGQYPKFKGEFYRLDEDALSLIPTAEVPLVNLYRDEIIDAENLPIAMTAATSCFRREAGAAGRDTRGLVRVHQFQKVEMVQICRPEDSPRIHEEMLKHAEEILKRLKLHYRVVLLCSGDMGATASKTYDLEVWMPGLDRFMEISSVSNCRDFQARRGRVRYKAAGSREKPLLVHTLNGSGLAAGRTLAAIFETYQNGDGTVTIPEALRPYMSGRGE
jgi:seryl-tRNA synthetase